MNLKERIEEIASKWLDNCDAEEITTDILKVFIEGLPPKKEYDKKTTNGYAQYSFQGYNQAIDDMKERLG